MRKTCGKPVHGARNSWVRTQFVPTTWGHKTMISANKSTRYTRLPQHASPAPTTTNLFNITLVRQHFSPLSTALIITTTKYK